MEIDLVDQTVVLALTPIVAGVVQVLKSLPKMPKSLAPLNTLVIGVVASFLWFDAPWREASLTGVVIGLTAAGFYSGVSSSRDALKERQNRLVSNAPTETV